MSKTNETYSEPVEIVNCDNCKQTPFSGYNNFTYKGKKFYPENIKIKRNGKEMNLSEYVESNREGTEIKEVLKKYSNDYTLTAEQMQANRQAIGDALGEINDLRDYLDKTKKAQELWNGLHGDIKSIFHNNISEFVANGEKWAKGLKENATANTQNMAQNTGQTGNTAGNE